MQQILVDFIVIAAVLFICRGIYRNVVSSRKSKTLACPGCGACESAAKSPAASQKH